MPEKPLLNLPAVRQTLDFTCGAACFDSMFRFFNGWSPGELHWAEKLGALALGYTPPENIVALARFYGFESDLIIGANFQNLAASLAKEDVIFVTWWYEDAGHYSLVKELETDQILLMDPWLEREKADNLISLKEFEANWSLRGSKMIWVRKPKDFISRSCGAPDSRRDPGEQKQNHN